MKMKVLLAFGKKARIWWERERKDNLERTYVKENQLNVNDTSRRFSNEQVKHRRKAF